MAQNTPAFAENLPSSAAYLRVEFHEMFQNALIFQEESRYAQSLLRTLSLMPVIPDETRIMILLTAAVQITTWRLLMRRIDRFIVNSVGCY